MNPTSKQPLSINEPLSVNVAEATRLLGFKDRRIVYKLIQSGELKARHAGRIILVNYKSLKAYAGEED